MAEFFIVAVSNPAPFVGDRTTGYHEGVNPRHALQEFVEGYSHPSGLYSADAYLSADAYHKHHGAAVRWRSNKALLDEARAEVTASPHGGRIV